MRRRSVNYNEELFKTTNRLFFVTIIFNKSIAVITISNIRIDKNKFLIPFSVFILFGTIKYFV